MDRFKVYHEQINIMLGVLEDDADFREEFANLLKSKGLVNFNIYPTADDLLNDMDEDFHIVVIDHLGIGSMNGLEVMKAVLKKNPYAFVIVYSGQESKQVVIDYLNEGAYKYIDKNAYKNSPHEAEQLLLKYISEASNNIKDEVVFFASIDRRLKEAEKTLLKNDSSGTDND